MMILNKTRLVYIRPNAQGGNDQKGRKIKFFLFVTTAALTDFRHLVNKTVFDQMRRFGPIMERHKTPDTRRKTNPAMQAIRLRSGQGMAGLINPPRQAWGLNKFEIATVDKE